MKPVLLVSQTTLSEEKLINYLQDKFKGRWIVSDYSSKSDFKEDLANLMIEYPTQTNIYLGDLDKLSLNFQQSILKFLEEPPFNLQIFLTKKSEYLLLPTIKSRSKIEYLTNTEISNLLDIDYINKIKGYFTPVMDATNKLIQSKLELEDFGDIANIERDDILFYLWQIEYYLCNSYNNQPNIVVAKRIQDILLSKQNLIENCQKKIALMPLLF
jgi:hypothetical protein